MKSNINALVETLVTVRQVDAKTGKIVSERPPVKNLVFDGALNGLARSTNATYPAELTVCCRVGDGSTADKVASGAVTFTQSGTTVTASAGFFTSGMVGWIFKYGTGTAGAEYYITAFTSSTQVTVDTSATVAVGEVATVWNVARTTLVNLLYNSTTYSTASSGCGSTLSAPNVAHKRTFNFAQQVSSYNVNEVGYFRTATGTTVFGRVVLGSTEVVAPTNFLQIVLTVTIIYSPSAPAAVGNVGTNIDTSGNAMLEGWRGGLNLGGFGYVDSSTGSASNSGIQSAADGSNTCNIAGIIASYSQNGSIQSTYLSGTTILFQSALGWAYAGTRGKMTLSSNTTISTSGQTLFGVCLFNGLTNTIIFDVKFTTGFTLPTGSFLPQVVFSCTYNRVLTN